jgi:ABC-type phosphate transport system substrate-binding protein
MKLRFQVRSLLGSASLAALSAAASLGLVESAQAQATNPLYFGGSTLASQLFRQIFDCYRGATVGGDGFSFTSSFPTTVTLVTPGALPTTCAASTVTTLGGFVTTVEGLYAGVGSGNGFRGYITNTPEEWYGGTATPNATIAPPPFPSSPPPFVDSGNPTATFGNYPYPTVDVGLSDSPLSATNISTSSVSFTPATGWTTTSGSITQVTVNGSTTTVTYNTSAFGLPVQLPAMEVAAAIAINTTTTSAGTWHINSALGSGGPGHPGQAIQLTEGQLCAIFSGLATDWSTTATIPFLTNAATPFNSAQFSYANTSSSVTAQPYFSGGTLPIRVVFRSDGSGTSFILTNYLHAVCPLIDPNNNVGYKQIFAPSTADIAAGYKPLPSTNFPDLQSNVEKFRSGATSAWVGASGSGGVADAIGDTASLAGSIGYLSNDFTNAYSNRPHAPGSASLQNEDQRINGINKPGDGGAVFIAPTPVSADNAWSDNNLKPPMTASYTAWNVYGVTFSTTEPAHGHVSVAGLSVLPLTNHASAYPLSGTTFLGLYSCYKDSAPAGFTYVRGQPLLDFLNWYFQTTNGFAGDPDVIAIIRNNGFHELNTGWLQNLQNLYLSPGNGTSIALISGGNVDGCSNNGTPVTPGG